MRLAGKIAIVTGAGRGIGRAIALAMAKGWASVVANAVGASVAGPGSDEGPSAEIVKAISEAEGLRGGGAVLNIDSVAARDGAQRIVARATERFGQRDVRVNNAGILGDAICHAMSVADWLAVIGVHLNGSFVVSRVAAPLFREQGAGASVHVISASGLIGTVGKANSAGAKRGMTAQAKSIALEMERFGVRSNGVSPFAWSRMVGSIRTDTSEQQARVAQLQKMAPETIAPRAVDLASDWREV